MINFNPAIAYVRKLPTRAMQYATKTFNGQSTTVAKEANWKADYLKCAVKGDFDGMAKIYKRIMG